MSLKEKFNIYISHVFLAPRAYCPLFPLTTFLFLVICGYDFKDMEKWKIQ